MKKLVILLAISWSMIYAHDLWIVPENNAYVLHYGHITSSHKGKKQIEYKANDIKNVLAFDKDGKEVNLSYKKAYPLRIDSGPSAVFVVFSTGYWTKTIEGEKNLPKDSVEMPIKSWLSYEYVKYMNAWDNKLKRPLTEYLEITPLFDINKVKRGDKVSFLITYHKKPLSNVVVAYNGKVRGTTDKDGKINIRIMENGLQLIQATYKEKGDGKKTDEIIHTSTLNWEIR